MKPNTFVILALLLAITCIVKSQTTKDEYDYIVRGYKIQLENKLEMKKGYKFTDYDTWGIDYGKFKRKVTFKGLFREGEDKPCALLMILERTDRDFEEYLCVPHYDSQEDLWDKAYNDFKIATADWSQASIGYAWGMIQFISYLVR